MSNIKINDVPQRIQYAATGGQTQFTIPFPFFANSYVYVWLNGIQLLQGGAPGQYVVTGAGSPSGGLVTFNTAATLNDIVTIEGIMPIDRTSIYSATISNLTGSDLNGDFNREVVMMQQINTVQQFLQLQYAPWAEVSQDPTVTRDRYLPILDPLTIWRMNAAGTAIETMTVPSSGGIAPDDGTYLVQTADADLPDAIALDELTTGFMVNVFGSGLSAIRTIAGVTNQTAVTNGSGAAGNPTIGIAANPLIPGTAGMGLPQGTTAQRVIPVSGIGLRFNTDTGNVEFWDGAVWVALGESGVSSVLGTAGRITSSGGSSPIIDIDAAYAGQSSIDTLGVITAGTWEADLIDKAFGGTGVSSATIAPASLEFAAWDTNLNLSANNHLSGFASTVSAAGNTILTVASAYAQEITGATTQTVTMPLTTTLEQGHPFKIINNSSANLTINSSGGNAILVMAANTTAFLTCVLNSGTTAASWNASYVFDNGAGVLSITGTANQVIASASTGAITLSLPQDIATSSTPKFVNSIPGFTSITSAAGTTTLTTTSNYKQQVVGSTTQTIQMPVTSTLQQGQPWEIINNSTGTVTVNSSGGNLIITLAANTAAILTCISTSGTTAASWTTSFSSSGSGSATITNWVQYTPTFTGFGTPTSVSIWSRRVGQNLEVRGKFTTGTTTVTEARISLGYNGTDSNVSSDGTVVTSIQHAGTMITGSGSFTIIGTCLIESGVGYITTGWQAGSNDGLTKLNGSSWGSSRTLSFMFSVPIASFP